MGVGAISVATDVFQFERPTSLRWFTSTEHGSANYEQAAAAWLNQETARPSPAVPESGRTARPVTSPEVVVERDQLDGEVPQDWEVPNNLAGKPELFACLTDAERTWAYRAAGFGEPLMPIANHIDLDFLPAEGLQKLQYHVATRLNGAVAS